MNLQLKHSGDNKMGFVERFNCYYYGETGNIQIIAGIKCFEDEDRYKFAKQYIMRESRFIPLSEVESQVGIGRYLKAKKAFYSLINDGVYVVKLKVGLNYVTGEYIKDKSSYTVYSPQALEHEAYTSSTLVLSPILQASEAIDKDMQLLMAEVASYKGSREAFLKSRL